MISNATYSGSFYDVSAQDSVPLGLAWKPDGTRFFIYGGVTGVVHQYNVSPAWDESSAIFAGSSGAVGSGFGPADINFKPDGTLLFALDESDGQLQAYALSTAWDVTTAAFNGDSKNVSIFGSTPRAVAFKPDGLTVLLVGAGLDTIKELTTDTPWLLTNLNATGQELNINAQDASPTGLEVSSDGLHLYLTGVSSQSVHSYTFGTSWVFSTLTYDNIFLDVSAQTIQPWAVRFRPDGDRMYILGANNSTVFRYDLPVVEVFPVSTPFNWVNLFKHLLPHGRAWRLTVDKPLRRFIDGLSSIASAARAFVDNVWADLFPQTTRELAAWEQNFGIIETGSLTEQERRDRLAGAWQALGGQSPSYIEQTLRGAGFLVRVYDWWEPAFTVPTGGDLNTAAYASKFISVTAQDTAPTDLHLSPNGLLMYVLGGNTGAVYQYTLGSAFNLSTAVYSGVSFSVSGQETTPTGIHISSDGALMYILGLNTDTIYQYDITTAFNVSTAVYSGLSFSVASEMGFPRGLHITTDGAIVYALSANPDQVHQYNLGTAFNISTAVYTSKVLSIAEEATPLGIYASDDGVDLYVCGSASSSVYQYTMSTPFDLATAIYALKSLSVSAQDISPSGIHIDPNAGAMYISASSGDFVFQYSIDFTPGEEIPPVTPGIQSRATARNPLIVLEDDPSSIEYIVEAGEALAEAGEALAEAGETASVVGYPLVNKISRTVRNYTVLAGEAVSEAGEALAEAGEYSGFETIVQPYVIPTNPDTWPYFLYVGGETFGAAATIDAARRDEFERLCLKICPTHQWIGVIVNYL